MTLILPQFLQDALEAQARRAFPNECCGLIAGIRQGADGHALALYPAPDGDKDRFAIAPEDHFAALKAARAEGRALIGCYHSHPNGVSHPSDADRAGADEEGFFWVILALDGRAAPVTLQAWRYRDGDFASVGCATGAD